MSSMEVVHNPKLAGKTQLIQVRKVAWSPVFFHVYCFEPDFSPSSPLCYTSRILQIYKPSFPLKFLQDFTSTYTQVQYIIMLHGWIPCTLPTHNIILFAYIKVICKVSLSFTPYPLFQWYPQSNEILLNISMKCWNVAFNVQGSRVTIVL